MWDEDGAEETNIRPVSRPREGQSDWKISLSPLLSPSPYLEGTASPSPGWGQGTAWQAAQATSKRRK